MGRIIKDLEVAGDKGKRVVKVLFDTGATASFVRQDVAQAIATVTKMPSVWRFRVADGRESLEVQETTHLEFVLKGHTLFGQFFIFDQLPHEMIIGADLMQRWKLVPVPEEEDIRITPEALVFEI